MELEACCSTPALAWAQSRVGERFSDILVCKSCQHIHKMESWLVPVDWPGVDGCVNCGGDLSLGPDTPKCRRCGLTPTKDRELHDGLAALHPERDYLSAALVAADLGRQVLALKLSSAAIRWSDDDPTVAHTVRLQALEGIGQLDRALDEAYAWGQSGGSSLVWAIIADLERTANNPRAALEALRYGTTIDPSDMAMWLDYSETALGLDDRTQASRAAAEALRGEETRQGALAVLTALVEREAHDGNGVGARATAEIAGEWVEGQPALMYQLARVAAAESQSDEAVGWLEKTLKLQPDHAEAQAAMLALKPKKRGWFW